MDTAKRAHIKNLVDLVLKQAAKVRDDAGYSGRMDDGGARVMEEQVRYYLYGLDGVVPVEWEREHGQKLDPEFAEYQRLHAKFKGR